MDEKKIEELINEVFNKAKIFCSSHNKNALSNHIVEQIEKKFGTKNTLTKETLSRAHDKFVSKIKPENSKPRKSTIELLCKYLGHENYVEYIKSKRDKNELFNLPIEAINKGSGKEKITPDSTTLMQKKPTKKSFFYAVIVVLFLVVTTLIIYQFTAPYNTIINLSSKPDLRVHPDYPKFNNKDIATLKIYLPKGVELKEIDNKNEVVFTDLPYGLLGEKIKIELVNKFWKLSKDSIVLKRGYLVLHIEPNESLSKIEGEVLTHLGGKPIENVTIHFDGLETKTNVFGLFSISVPMEKRRNQYELKIYKKGYKNYSKIYFPGAKTQIRLLKNNQ